MENKLNISPLLAGVLGGGASTILLYPLDLVKVRLQVNEDPSRLTRRSIAHTMRGVIRHEGITGLYQGLVPALFGSAASWGGYFFFYEGIKSQMLERKVNMNSNSSSSLNHKTDVKLAASENFTAACIAGAIMVIFTNPIWLVKTRMQLQMKRTEAKRQLSAKFKNASLNSAIKAPYKSMTDAFRTIVREEGPFALYKGAAPAMMLVSHGGVQFVSYEFLKSHLGTYTKAKRSADKENWSVTQMFHDSVGYLTMGAVSKIIASTATYPIQVIKSRLQQRSQGTELSAAGNIKFVKRKYNGVLDCISRIWKLEGVIGFFKGSIPNALRVAPSAAIVFVVYESTMDFLS